MIKDQSKFVSASQVFIALSFLFTVFLHLKSALSYDGLENNFWADNWGTPLIIFLTIFFGLGWRFGSFVRYLILSKGIKTGALVVAGLCLIFISIVFVSLTFIPASFLRYALMGSGYILMSGFFLRFSVTIPEIFAKQQEIR